MKKFAIVLQLFFLIMYGCSSAEKQDVKQQCIQTSDSMITIRNEYTMMYVSLIEQDYLSFSSQPKLSDEEKTTMLETMDQYHKKLLSLSDKRVDLYKKIGMTESPGWMDFMFLDSKIQFMQAEFISIMKYPEEKLAPDSFYTFVVKSYINRIDSLNELIWSRFNQIKEMNLKSDLSYLRKYDNQ